LLSFDDFRYILKVDEGLVGFSNSLFETNRYSAAFRPSILGKWLLDLWGAKYGMVAQLPDLGVIGSIRGWL
jgi:hypothetical protein